jgi:hypothetical protein
MLAPVIRSPGVLAMTALLVLGACVRVEAGTDPEPLGYGPGAHAMLGAGYDINPVERPAPTSWDPPAHELGFAFEFEPPSEAAPEPIAYNPDLVRVCERLSSFVGEPDACLQRYRIERVFRTIADWKTLAACLEAASDQAAASACEHATPRVFGPIAEHLRESEVCMHIFAITIVEQLGAEPMLDHERIAEFEPLLVDCVESLVTEERADRKPAEYVEMLDCMQRALTTATAELCE